MVEFIVQGGVGVNHFPVLMKDSVGGDPSKLYSCSL